MAQGGVFLAVAVGVLCCGFLGLVEAVGDDGCEYLGKITDACSSAKSIVVKGQVIEKGKYTVEGKRIDFESKPQAYVDWNCGSASERSVWDKEGNRLYVKYWDDGKIEWQFYKCDLSGPKSAGLQCSAELVKPYHCPGTVNDSQSEPCLFEKKEMKSKSREETESTQVGGGLKGDVTRSNQYSDAKAELDARASKSNTIQTAVEFTVDSKTYILVPPGTFYCVLRDGRSIKYESAPTGFKWQCSSTKFVQGPPGESGTCSEHPRCEASGCEDDDPFAAAPAIHVSGSLLAVATLMSAFPMFL